jgi:hypothetical protein
MLGEAREIFEDLPATSMLRGLAGAGEGQPASLTAHVAPA